MTNWAGPTVVTAIRQFTDRAGDGNPATKIAKALLDDSLSLEALKEHQGKPQFLEAGLDLVLFCVEQCLHEHPLSDEDCSAIEQLKNIFAIEEGDFVKLRRNQVKCLLEGECERILADRVVNHDESLLLVRLQRTFGIGYDEFVELTKDAYERIVDVIIRQITSDNQITAEEREALNRQLSAFDTIYAFTPRQLKLLEGCSAGDSRTRTIPEEVRHEVWRREGGKCLKCGSARLLEYDHIIPFSMGGSNTARNIQLLCQTCNRKKADGLY